MAFTTKAAEDGGDSLRLRDKMERHVELIKDRLETEFGLLDKLLSSGVLLRQEISKIKREGADAFEKSEKLLEYIFAKNRCEDFIQCLINANQTHLVNYLRSDGEYSSSLHDDDWPLTEREMHLLDANQESLSDMMDTSELLNRLLSKKVINHRQNEFISSKTLSYEKASTLLDIIRRSSCASFKKLIECLKDSNQSHVADILQSGTVVVAIHCEFGGARTTEDGEVQEGTLTEKDVDKGDEDEIVRKMEVLLANKSEDEAHRILSRLQARLLTVKKSGSICLYFLCDCLKELLQLKDLLNSGRLRSAVETIFSQLLSTEMTPRSIKVTLAFKSSETYKKCKTFLALLQGERGQQQQHAAVHHEHEQQQHAAVHHEHEQQLHTVHVHDEHESHVHHELQQSTFDAYDKKTDVGLPRREEFLRVNHDSLVNILGARELTEDLFLKEVISRQQKDLISAAETDIQKNEILLEILKEGTLDEYRKTIQCLRQNRKSDIAEILERNGALARVEAEISGPDARATIISIVEKINRLLGDKMSSGYSQLFELTRLKLVAASVSASSDSAVLYFYPPTLKDLQHIFEQLKLDYMKSFVEPVFNNLLPPSDERRKVTQLKWSEEIYASLQRYLLESEKISSEPQRLISQSDEVSKTTIDRIPDELLDSILLRAFQEAVCCRFQGLLDAGEKCFYRRLASVNVFWFQTIRRRRFKALLGRHLRDFYKRVAIEAALLRNNWKYLVESIETKAIFGRLCLSGCLGDDRPWHIKERKFSSRKNEDLLVAMRTDALSTSAPSLSMASGSFLSTLYLSVIESLRCTDQEHVADLLERGGVVVNVRLVYGMIKGSIDDQHQNLMVERLNEVLKMKSNPPRSMWKLLWQLDEKGVDIFNVSADRGILMRFRCRHKKALNRLRRDYHSGELLKLLRNVLHETMKIFQLSRPLYASRRDVRLSVDNEDFLRQPVALQPSVALTTSLDVGDRWVAGVTSLESTIYVLCHSPSVILVYDHQSPFTLLREISTDEIKQPSDIAASQPSSCFYITDRGPLNRRTEAHETSCIWKVTPTGDGMSRWLSDVDNPFTLSVTHDGRVLMLRWTEAPRLEIYASDALLIRAITPPSTIEYPRHALETSQGHWIVCYWVRPNETWGICELAAVDEGSDGVEIRRKFDLTDVPLNHTYHLALDSYDRVFVADFSNNRIVHFDPEFRWSRVVLTDVRHGIVAPCRMHCDGVKKQLIVVHGGRGFRDIPGAWGGRQVNIYQIG